MAKNQKPPSSDQKFKSSINYQSYQYEQQGNVSKAMMSAGPGRNRLAAGMKAAWNARTSSPFGTGGPKTIGGTALRLFGKQTAAMWYDRLLAYDTRASKARREKKQGKDDDGGQQVAAQAFGGIGESLQKIQKVMNLQSAALISIGRDVGHIKTMMMPKFFNVKMGKKAGNQGIAYSPMAPEGQQIKLTENGKITSTTPGSRFKDKAVEKAAMITARLALKIDKQDQAKSALKRKFAEPSERNRFAKDPFAALSESLADLKEQNEEILENQEEAKDKGLFSKIGDFLQDWWAFSPFLGFFKAFAKLGLLGVAGYFGYKVGEWLYDKFGTQMLDAIFWVKDKWAELSNWFNNFSLEEFFLPLTQAIRKVTDFLHITKSDEEYKAEEKKNAAAGRTRGAIASSKGMSADDSIAHYDKLSRDKSLTPEAREANAKARDALMGSKMRTSEGVPTHIATPEATARTGSVRGRRREKSVPAGERSTLSVKSSETTISGEQDIKNMIMGHEGVRYRPYKDSRGLWTVGVGHLIGDGKTLPAHMDREFSKEEVTAMFEQDYAHHRRAAAKLPGFNKLNKKGQGALIDLTFNMGPNWMKKFPSVAKALSENPPNVEKAAGILEGSLWYKQVATRGPVIVDMVRAGLDPSGEPILPSPTDTGTSIRVASATTVTPAPPMSASKVEGDSRALSASKEGPVQVAMVAPTTVNNTTNTTRTPPRPLPKAKAVSSDDSFVRNTASATVHPTAA